MTDLARVALDSDQVITVTGEIDLSNAARVRDAIGAVIPDLLLAERLSYNRQELQLVVPPDAPIRAMIRLTNLDQVIRVTPVPPER